MKMLSLIGAILLTAVAASAAPFKFEDMAKIKVGMSYKEVKAVIGSPYRTDVDPNNPFFGPKTRWWKDKERGLAGLVFNGSRVSQKLPLPDVGK